MHNLYRTFPGGDLEHMGEDPLHFMEETDVEHLETIAGIEEFSPEYREGALKILDLIDNLQKSDKEQTE